MLFRVILIFCLFLPLTGTAAGISFHTVWGTRHLLKGPVIELLNHPALLRLHHIDQSGPGPYFLERFPFFSRFEHSIGVLALLQKAGVSIEEQIAGLFHDASHTAFSHTGDHIFTPGDQENSYHDNVHLKFLVQKKVYKSVKDFMVLERLDPGNPKYKALECPLPGVCADRLQYLVHSGVIFNKITNQEARFITDNVNFNGEHWVFNDSLPAKMLASLSVGFTKEFWGSPWNFYLNKFFSDILKRAIMLEYITLDDIRYGTDPKIINFLQECRDKQIQEALLRVGNIKDHFTEVPYGEGVFNYRPKCRAVDPLVESSEGLMPLSTIDRVCPSS
jgi:HD superfamily phosphohydrolase